MAVIKALARWFSYVFHGLLTLFLIAVAALALLSSVQALSMNMLPWTGATLLWVLFGGGIIGFVTLLLALRSKWRGLFFLWSLAVAILLLKGYIFSGYRFAPGEAVRAFCLIAAALFSVPGAWFQMRWQPDRDRRLRY